MKICKNGLGHTIKVAVMPIYGKTPSKIFFSRISGPIAMKLGIQHCGCRFIILLTNYDARLTMTYFIPRSTLVAQAFIWKKELIFMYLCFENL